MHTIARAKHLEKKSHAWENLISYVKQNLKLICKIAMMISHDDCMCVIHMR
jgi:hypothetical protein